jgi:hypothetical protein
MKGENAMAIIVITEEQQRTVAAIEQAIDAGVVEEWTYSGRDFVLGAEGGLRRTIDKGAVIFGVVPGPGVPLTPTNYARLHGRFLELLLEHADRTFDCVEITAQPCEYDFYQDEKVGRMSASDEEDGCPETPDEMAPASC